MPRDDASQLRHAVESVLQDVIDPEIGQSVVDVGLIYDITRSGDSIHVSMTTTSRGCPAADFLVDAVGERIRAAGIGVRVEVALTYDPPWSPAMIRS